MPYTFDYHFLRNSATVFEILNLSDKDVTLKIANLGIKCKLTKASRTMFCKCNYLTMQRNFIVELGAVGAMTHRFTRLDSPYRNIDFLLIEPVVDLSLKAVTEKFATLNDVMVDLEKIVFQNTFKTNNWRQTEICLCKETCHFSAHFRSI